MDKITALFSIIFGFIFMVFSKPLSRYATNSWRKHIKIATPSETIYKIFAIVGGSIFILLGMLSLLGVIPFNK